MTPRIIPVPVIDKVQEAMRTAQAALVSAIRTHAVHSFSVAIEIAAHKELDEAITALQSLQPVAAPVEAPIDMVLHCPACRYQHIDKPHDDWTNQPHKTHQCQACRHEWRPANVPTNGVAELPKV